MTIGRFLTIGIVVRMQAKVVVPSGRENKTHCEGNKNIMTSEPIKLQLVRLREK